jgi:hypothetical protein
MGIISIEGSQSDDVGKSIKVSQDRGKVSTNWRSFIKREIEDYVSTFNWSKICIITQLSWMVLKNYCCPFTLFLRLLLLLAELFIFTYDSCSCYLITLQCCIYLLTWVGSHGEGSCCTKGVPYHWRRTNTMYRWCFLGHIDWRACGLDDLTLFLLQQHLSKYTKKSVRSLSQKISREATFYGALMRLQRNWKVRQRSHYWIWGEFRLCCFVI